MASSSKEIGLKLQSSGQLDAFEQAVEKDDSMQVVTILQGVGVDEEIVARMLLQLDKDYLRELVDAGRSAAG